MKLSLIKEKEEYELKFKEIKNIKKNLMKSKIIESWFNK